MKVNLRNDWFGPDGSLHRKSDNPHDFLDEWDVLIPASAVRIEEIISEAEAVSSETAEAAKRRELEAMSVSDLTDLADAQGVEYDAATTCEELIDLIIDEGE